MSEVDSSVPLMHHDPHRSWITDPDPNHTTGTHPKFMNSHKLFIKIMINYQEEFCSESIGPSHSGWSMDLPS